VAEATIHKDSSAEARSGCARPAYNRKYPHRKIFGSICSGGSTVLCRAGSTWVRSVGVAFSGLKPHPRGVVCGRAEAVPW